MALPCALRRQRPRDYYSFTFALFYAAAVDLQLKFRTGTRNSGRRATWLILVLVAATTALSCSNSNNNNNNGSTVDSSPNQGCNSSGNIYVRTDGSDTNAGSTSEPLQTIHAAVACATAGQSIHVASGTYQAHQNGNGWLELQEGKSIYGGYSSDFSVRDPVLFLTVIESNLDGNLVPEVTTATVRVAPETTEQTELNGFTIYGTNVGSWDSVAAIIVAGGGAKIENNVIDGRGVCDRTVAIEVRGGGSPVIRNNTIIGGTGVSVGILSAAGSGPNSATIENNSISGGSGSGSGCFHVGAQGISWTSSGEGELVVRGNTVSGAASQTRTDGIYVDASGPILLESNSVTTSSASIVTGIDVKGSSVVVRNNVVSMGAAELGLEGIVLQSTTSLVVSNNTVAGSVSLAMDPLGATGILLKTPASNPDIRNNIVDLKVFAWSRSIHRCISTFVGAEPSILQNNNLFGCQVLYSGNGVSATTIDEVNDLTGVDSSENVSTNSFLDSAEDFRPTVATPATITEGGQDLSALFSTDKDGNDRTVPWSMGAYQATPPDPPCGSGASIYVRTDGDDANAGTLSEPLQTIHAAAACGIPGQTIHVATGTYETHSNGKSWINLKEGSSIYGGYSADYAVRDPAAYPTVITSNLDGNLVPEVSTTTVRVDPEATSQTELSGFTIYGTNVGNWESVSAINVAGGRPVIENNIIEGRGVCFANAGNTASRTAAIEVNGGSPLIRGNMITGGIGDSAGIRGDGNPGAATIENNSIDGGTSGPNPCFGPQAIGINWSSTGFSTLRIRNNDIRGGPAIWSDSGILIDTLGAVVIEDNAVAAAFADFMTGIHVKGHQVTIRNNVVDMTGAAGQFQQGMVLRATNSLSVANNTLAGSVSDSSQGVPVTAIELRTPISNVRMRNNIVDITASGPSFLGHTCLSAGSSESSIISFQNNNLFGCQTLYSGSIEAMTIDEVNNLASINASDNVSVNSQLDSAQGYRPTGASPASITQGGQDLSAIFTTDKDGKERTVPWSLGAYDFDQ
jgi:hypothetical protein